MQHRTTSIALMIDRRCPRCFHFKYLDYELSYMINFTNVTILCFCFTFQLFAGYSRLAARKNETTAFQVGSRILMWISSMNL